MFTAHSSTFDAIVSSEPASYVIALETAMTYVRTYGWAVVVCDEVIVWSSNIDLPQTVNA